jgi:hypothetical protein
LFSRCRRAIIVFTVPKDENIPADLWERLKPMAFNLLPNLSQARVAVTHGITAYFTLSVYLEGSVLECPDLILSIKDYLWFSWSNRSLSTSEFDKKYNELFAEPKVITEDMVSDWITEREELYRTITDFKVTAASWQQSWKRFVNFVENHPSFDSRGFMQFLPEEFVHPDNKSLTINKICQSYSLTNRVKMQKLYDQKIGDFVLRRSQVVAALNYIMYIKHYGNP